MKAATIATAAFVAAMTPALAWAGPWLHDAGNGYLELGTTFFSADDGVRDGVATGLAYRSVTVGTYAEIGLPGHLQLTLAAPWVAATHTSASGVVYRNRSLGDTRLALDFAPTRRLPFAVGVEVKAPLYRDPFEQSSADGIDDDVFDPVKFPSVGSNGWDVTPRVQLGHSFYPVPMWTQIELGYRVSGCQEHGSPCRDYRDGALVSGSIGGFVWRQHLALEGYAKAFVPVQAETARKAPTEQFVYVRGKVTGGDLPGLPDLAITLGVGGIVHAVGTERGRDVSVSLSYRF